MISGLICGLNFDAVIVVVPEWSVVTTARGTAGYKLLHLCFMSAVCFNLCPTPHQVCHYCYTVKDSIVQTVRGQIHFQTLIPFLITRSKRAGILQEFVLTPHRHNTMQITSVLFTSLTGNVWSEPVVWHPPVVSEERKTLKRLTDPVLKQVSQTSGMNCPLELISSINYKGSLGNWFRLDTGLPGSLT